MEVSYIGSIVIILFVWWVWSCITYIYTMLGTDCEDVVGLVIEDFKGEINGWRLVVILIVLPYTITILVAPYIKYAIMSFFNLRLFKNINRAMSYKLFKGEDKWINTQQSLKHSLTSNLSHYYQSYS